MIVPSINFIFALLVITDSVLPVTSLYKRT